MTKTDLANIALGHLGEFRVMDIDEQTPSAEHCRRMWVLARDKMLRARHWNFALHQASLAALATAPLFDWGYAYALPSDYLLAVEVNGWVAGTGAAQFEIMGGRLLTDAPYASLTYIRRIENPEEWDASFCDAFAYKLASLVAPSITSAQGLAQNLAQSAQMATLEAAGPDNLETRPRAVLATTGSAWMAARLGVTIGRPVRDGSRVITTGSTTPGTTPIVTPPPVSSGGEIVVDFDGVPIVDADGNPIYSIP